jgi:hypothetical protein
MDQELPDLVNKPGQFLQEILAGNKGEFEIQELVQIAADEGNEFQKKVIEQRQKEVEAEKKTRDL